MAVAVDVSVAVAVSVGDVPGVGVRMGVGACPHAERKIKRNRKEKYKVLQYFLNTKDTTVTKEHDSRFVLLFPF